MSAIDMFATEPQFVDHLAAVWHALAPEQRGDFIVPQRFASRARTRGAPGANEVHDPTRPVLVASYGDQKKARVMGRTRIAFIEHGAGQSYGGDPRSADHASYAGGRDRGDASLFLVPNEYSAARWRAAYPAAAVHVVGSPKAEALPRRVAGPGPVVAVSFHFPCAISPEAGSAWGDFRIALPELAERYTVIGHGHPRAFAMLGLHRHYARTGIETVDDFEEVCRRADLYVGDNSSSIYEFASTGRPVVVMNARAYRPHVHHGGRFWDWATVGLQCSDPRELARVVAEALGDRPEAAAERERVLGLVYPVRAGAASLAADALAAWAGERKAVAA